MLRKSSLVCGVQHVRVRHREVGGFDYRTGRQKLNFDSKFLKSRRVVIQFCAHYERRSVQRVN
jgi:hypothetical protein